MESNVRDDVCVPSQIHRKQIAPSLKTRTPYVIQNTVFIYLLRRHPRVAGLCGVALNPNKFNFIYISITQQGHIGATGRQIKAVDWIKEHTLPDSWT